MILPFSGYQDFDEVLESGDETYFPALHVGLGPEKTSIVVGWHLCYTVMRSRQFFSEEALLVGFELGFKFFWNLNWSFI